MRRLALLVVFLAGVVAGAFLGSLLSGEQMVRLEITNASAQPLESVCVAEDRFAFRYCVDGPLSPGTSSVLPIPTHGKVGYKLSVKFADERHLERAFYAEEGWRVEHAVSESQISYKPTDLGIPFRAIGRQGGAS